MAKKKFFTVDLGISKIVTVHVEASSKEEAEEKAKQAYWRGDYDAGQIDEVITNILIEG